MLPCPGVECLWTWCDVVVLQQVLQKVMGYMGYYTRCGKIRDVLCVQVVRPILGITIAPPQTVRQIGLEGVLILEVPSNAPAFKAGLRGTYR